MFAEIFLHWVSCSAHGNSVKSLVGNVANLMQRRVAPPTFLPPRGFALILLSPRSRGRGRRATKAEHKRGPAHTLTKLLAAELPLAQGSFILFTYHEFIQQQGAANFFHAQAHVPA